MSGEGAHAGKIGTKYKYQRLMELSAKGPNGEALALGYETATHSFGVPYNMTGAYVLVVRGGGRDANSRPIDVYDTLPEEKIAQMQRAGALPNPLPPYRITIVDYLGGYVLWWAFPLTFVFIWIFSKLGIGTPIRDGSRSA